MTPGPRRQLSWWQDGEKRPLFHPFPEPQCPLLNEGLRVPSPPGAGGLAVQPLLDQLSGTGPPQASWGCGFRACPLRAMWTLTLQGEELRGGCRLPSAVRLFWCKLKILQE